MKTPPCRASVRSETNLRCSNTGKYKLLLHKRDLRFSRRWKFELWVVTPCSVVSMLPPSSGALHPADGSSMDLLKRWYLTTTLHGVMTQKTSI